MAVVPKLIPYTESFPKISADNLLELLRELRQDTTSKERQDVNSIEIEPCVRLLASVVDYLNGGTVDNVIDKFVLAVCARVGVQFLGNSIVENEKNREILWKHSALLRKIFCHNDTKLKNYISMVYYNVMLNCAGAREELLEDDLFMDVLLEEAILGLTEFPQFILEKYLEFGYYNRVYNEKRKPLHKIYLLDLLSSLLRADKGFELSTDNVKRISEDFKNQADVILNGRKRNDADTDTDKDKGLDVDPRLAVKLLSMLCSLSINDKYSKLIRDNTALIIDTIYVLRAMQMVEDAKREDDSEPVNDLSNDSIIGFKADLIRLLGNVCFKNKKNQDLIRENNCIELILNCCKLDEKNPFICEWSIMAIRNLCEDNQANQDFIASLKRITETDLVAMAEKLKLNRGDQNCP